MQQTTNTPKKEDKLATGEVITQIAQYIDGAASVHIIWDVPGIANGETTIRAPGYGPRHGSVPFRLLIREILKRRLRCVITSPICQYQRANKLEATVFVCWDSA